MSLVPPPPMAFRKNCMNDEVGGIYSDCFVYSKNTTDNHWVRDEP